MVNLVAFVLNFLKISSVLTLFYPTFVSGECTCDINEATNGEPSTLNYKLASIASILVAGGLGVSLPLLGKRVKALNPDSDVFLMVKAFAAGVILATGFIHILPHAFEHLTSPCLSQNPWKNFPFAGFVAMMTAIGTLIVDSFATGFYQRLHYSNNKIKQVNADVDEEIGGDHHAGHVHVHTHATHGHAHGSAAVASSPHGQDLVMSHELIRRRIISQVLELGIVVHSVIIGISLGASNDPDTIKPLLVALSFHQFFEGMGLGGCISQAQFKSRSMAIMATFFSLTTPVGIAIGIGVSSIYKENSPTALIVEGVFNSASAGILIYMALVDLLAQDFMDPRMQANVSVQLGAYTSLLLGSACMSVLAKWA